MKKKLNILSPVLDSFQVEINHGATVLSLKRAIAKNTQIKEEDQRIFYKGREMKNDQILKHFNLKQDTVHLINRSFSFKSVKLEPYQKGILTGNDASKHKKVSCLDITDQEKKKCDNDNGPKESLSLDDFLNEEQKIGTQVYVEQKPFTNHDFCANEANQIISTHDFATQNEKRVQTLVKRMRLFKGDYPTGGLHLPFHLTLMSPHFKLLAHLIAELSSPILIYTVLLVQQPKQKKSVSTSAMDLVSEAITGENYYESIEIKSMEQPSPLRVSYKIPKSPPIKRRKSIKVPRNSVSQISSNSISTLTAYSHQDEGDGSFFTKLLQCFMCCLPT